MDRESRSGWWISGTAHTGLILWAVLGGFIFRPQPAPVIRMTEVATMSSADFEAYAASAHGSGPVSNVSTSIDAISAPDLTASGATSTPANASPPVVEAEAQPLPTPDATTEPRPDLSDFAEQPRVAVTTDLPAPINQPAPADETRPALPATPEPPASVNNPAQPASPIPDSAATPVPPRSELALDASALPQPRPAGLVAAYEARIAEQAAAARLAIEAAEQAEREAETRRAAEAAERAAENQRAAEAAERAAEDARRAAESEQRQLEAARAAEEQRRADEAEAARAAEARAEEERRAAEAERRRADEAAAEARRAEQRRIEEARAAEEQRRADEARAAEAQAEADRRAAEARAEEERRAAEARVEEDRRRAAAAEAERAAEERRAEAARAAAAQAEDDRRAAEARAEEERRRALEDALREAREGQAGDAATGTAVTGADPFGGAQRIDGGLGASADQDPLAAALSGALSQGAASEPAPMQLLPSPIAPVREMSQAPVGLPLGDPLTLSERDGFRLAIRDCWNVGALSVEASRMTVSVGFRMGPDGRPEPSSLRLVDFRDGSATAAAHAFDVASRAIRMCGRNGFALPAQKYARWQDVIVDFRPDGIGFE